jgi:hypothetical protein
MRCSNNPHHIVPALIDGLCPACHKKFKDVEEAKDRWQNVKKMRTRQRKEYRANRIKNGGM